MAFIREDGLRRAPIQVRQSPIAGRGVFAGRTILADALIEECPILIVTDTPVELDNYVIRWGEDDSLVCGLPLGYGALYNHSDDPNAAWETDMERALMIIWALREISADQEILISYGPLWFKDRPGVQR